MFKTNTQYLILSDWCFFLIALEVVLGYLFHAGRMTGWVIHIYIMSVYACKLINVCLIAFDFILFYLLVFPNFQDKKMVDQGIKKQ